MILEQVIYYNPDDDDFYGDRVGTEFQVDGVVKLKYTSDVGDNHVDLMFDGYMKAYQHIYGDGNVTVKRTKTCCVDWDAVDNFYDE